MHFDDVTPWQHPHDFVADRPVRAERRTRWVVVITAAMMIAEIVAGLAFRSMALLADGWHMATHAAAIGVAVLAYVYARKHHADPRYTFGTGKVSALGGFASAVGLAVAALLVLVESCARLAAPVAIRFDEAIGVAVLGLAVNLLCAWLLRDDHDEHHHHEHADHVQGSRGHAAHRDHNLRAAYLHVLADAMTSLFAIAALTAGKFLGWTWMDPVMGIVGAVVIARWSVGLLRDTSSVLLDAEVSRERRDAVRAALEVEGDRVADLHLWRVGPKHFAVIASLVSAAPRAPAWYRHRLEAFEDLAHLTIEVHPCERVPVHRVGA